MIGIFDSGSGGLTVLKKIKEVNPDVDIVYFGDIKNVPYGNRSQEELENLTEEAIKFLLQQGATQIVSACNSVSAVVLHKLSDGSFDSDKIIEMSQPTVKKLYKSNESLVLFGTSATIREGVYKKAFKEMGKEVNAIAIPELAEAIEMEAPHNELHKIIDEAVGGSLKYNLDIAILGCTQFPLVGDIFSEVFQKYDHEVSLYDPADAVSEEVSNQFNVEGNGDLKFILSKDSKTFRDIADSMFNKYKYEITVI